MVRREQSGESVERRDSQPAAAGSAAGPPIEGLRCDAFVIPTDRPESDATCTWDSTTLVTVEARAAGRTGLGYTYTDAATVRLIESALGPVVAGRDSLQVAGAWMAMQHALRNIGKPGLGACAIAAVDAALWDLKARLLDLPLVTLLDGHSPHVAVYASGGFTSYSDDELRQQFARWRAEGIRTFKMKVGRSPGEDVRRVGVARRVIGEDAELFVDANGGLTRKRALHFDGALVQQDGRLEPDRSRPGHGLVLERRAAEPFRV